MMLESLRGSFKRVIIPLARFLAQHGVTANMITVVGSSAVIVVACVTAMTGWLFVGSILLTLCTLADALDGSVAAVTGGGTQFGAFLDSTLDRIADWSLFVVVLICLYRAQPEQIMPIFTVAWGCVMRVVSLFVGLIALMAAFVTSYARARGQSLHVDPKVGLVTRADRIAIILVAMAIAGLTGYYYWLSIAMMVLAVGGVITVVQRIEQVRHYLR